MGKPAIYDLWSWDVPSHVPPGQPVRYWPQALLTGALVAASAYPAALWLGWQVPSSQSLMSFGNALKGSSAALMNIATATMCLREPASAFWELASEQATTATLVRVGLAAGLAGWLSAWATRRGLIPRANQWHVSGVQLLEGKEAVAEARRRSLSRTELRSETHALSIHPEWMRAKKDWAQHMLIWGGTGQGKSVVLKHILAQVIGKNKKAFIYDIKGDFTAIFRRPVIVCPFDKRSYVWDVGQDVATQTQAAAFAQSIIPVESGAGAFWATAAQTLLEGCVRELQATRQRDWGWADLAALLARPAKPMFEAMSVYFPRAAMLIASEDSNTTGSVLACLANGTAVIDRLATAWPKREPKRSFSMVAWIQDEYKGRKQLIVQSGPDPLLARAYISAMINSVVPEILALKDDERGRHLGFYFDELTTAGKLNIEPLIAVGRSKGVSLVACVQDLSQIQEVYGDKAAQAFESMIGTVVCCKTAGATAVELAGKMGKRTVAWRTHDKNATLHEESRAVVSSGRLTDDLGPRKGKQYGPEGWGIRAIVQTTGDLLLLNWPGVSYPVVREGQERAAWTEEGAQPVQKMPIPTADASSTAELHRVLKMSADEAAAELTKRGGVPAKLRAVSDAELEAIFRRGA